MNQQTVVGVFENSGEAMQVRQELIQRGIPSDSVRVQASIEGDAIAVDRGRDGGVKGFFRNLFGSDGEDDARRYADAIRRGGAVVTADLASDMQVREVEEVMERHHPIDIDERTAREGHREGLGWNRDADLTSERIPAVEEDLRVGKREVQTGGVRVFRRVEEVPVEEQVTLREQRARVERRATDWPATEEEMQALRDGQTFEVRETAEEPVVSKTARVVEEVDVSTEPSERTETVRDTVRRSTVDVEEDSSRTSGSMDLKDSRTIRPMDGEDTRGITPREDDDLGRGRKPGDGSRLPGGRNRNR